MFVRIVARILALLVLLAGLLVSWGFSQISGAFGDAVSGRRSGGVDAVTFMLSFSGFGIVAVLLWMGADILDKLDALQSRLDADRDREVVSALTQVSIVASRPALEDPPIVGSASGLAVADESSAPTEVPELPQEPEVRTCSVVPAGDLRTPRFEARVYWPSGGWYVVDEELLPRGTKMDANDPLAVPVAVTAVENLKRRFEGAGWTELPATS